MIVPSAAFRPLERVKVQAFNLFETLPTGEGSVSGKLEFGLFVLGDGGRTRCKVG